MPNQGALSNLDHDAAISEIASGTLAKKIAAKYGTTAQGLRIALKRKNPEAYKDAVASQVEHWVFDSADEMNELPMDAVCIARARTRADFRLKLASKLNPDYADKSQITQVSLTVLATDALAGDASLLLRSLRGGNNGGNTIDGQSIKSIESKD